MNMTDAAVSIIATDLKGTSSSQMSAKAMKRVYKKWKRFTFTQISWQATNSLSCNTGTFMNTDKPFGMEMNDDGLPEYSPDRNNIVAYHMYKPGLTDKLPDPEDTHTPFFRTPS